jgi:hypothetical protein
MPGGGLNLLGKFESESVFRLDAFMDAALPIDAVTQKPAPI